MLALILPPLALAPRAPLLRARSLRRTPSPRMPEGPEVRLHGERLHERCSGRVLRQAEILSGRYLATDRGAAPGRGAPPADWAELQAELPARVEAVRSKGKFMWFELSGRTRPLSVWSTLGMTGAWSLERGAHARLRLELCDEAGTADQLHFHDQRNFGTLTVCLDEAKLAAKLASLGPSWLDGLSLADFRAVVAAQCGTPRRAQVAVAKFLMDQSKTAGIGNYVLSETLHAARVWPWARCGDLDDEAWADVHAAAADVIGRSYSSQAALAAAQGRGAISATRGTTWTFELRAYRQTRTACGQPIVRAEGPHGRAVFWAPELQTRGWRPAEPG